MVSDGTSVLVGDIGSTADSSQVQTSIVRVDGQRSVYLPVLKQGGDANNIAVVDGIRKAVADLVDTPNCPPRSAARNSTTSRSSRCICHNGARSRWLPWSPRHCKTDPKSARCVTDVIHRRSSRRRW